MVVRGHFYSSYLPGNEMHYFSSSVSYFISYLIIDHKYTEAAIFENLSLRITDVLGLWLQWVPRAFMGVFEIELRKESS